MLLNGFTVVLNLNDFRYELKMWLNLHLTMLQNPALNLWHAPPLPPFYAGLGWGWCIPFIEAAAAAFGLPLGPFGTPYGWWGDGFGNECAAAPFTGGFVVLEWSNVQVAIFLHRSPNLHGFFPLKPPGPGLLGGVGYVGCCHAWFGSPGIGLG